MTAIGGFFELELPRGGASYHPDAVAMSSGRGCLRRILEHLGPARVWAPFYVCDAVLPAIAHAGASVEFYAVDDALEPVLPAGQPSSRDVLMYVNYFGLKATAASSLAASLGNRAVIDDSQAFFQQGYAGSSSFNSARKFFGVPDGAYAYGDGLAAAPSTNPSAPIRYEHLVSRLLGDQERAFRQYRDSEACVTDEPAAMSPFTTRVLSGVDYAAVGRARDQNFARLHETLGSKNRLQIDDGAVKGPFCYPLLLDRPVPWEALWRREVFAPRLWADVEMREGGAVFAWERRLASHLIPLPIDQRYGVEDMDRVARTVGEVVGW
jgi:hypothetical protein